MPTVYFDKVFTARVTELCEIKNEITKKSIFDTNLDFMIFAAMIGRKFNESTEDVKVEKGNKEIPDRIFKNMDKDSIVYLLALDAEKNGEILRGDDDNKLWKYIENYAYLGCQEIEKWIAERVGHDLEDILLEQIKQIALTIEENNLDVNDPDIAFRL
jgi:dnd system-associated protein 4